MFSYAILFHFCFHMIRFSYWYDHRKKNDIFGKCLAHFFDLPPFSKKKQYSIGKACG